MRAPALFDVDQLPVHATIERQIACIDRELRLRRHRFPRLVLAGQMSQQRANEEIALMEAVRATLVRALAAEAT